MIRRSLLVSLLVASCSAPMSESECGEICAQGTVCDPVSQTCQAEVVTGDDAGTDAGSDVAIDAGPETDGGFVTVDAGAPDAGMPEVDAGTICTTDTWASYGSTFFANTCNSCHRNEFNSQTKVLANKTNIRSRINSGSMPKNSTLSAANKARILQYLDCNVP